MVGLLINIIGSTLSAFSWIPQIIKIVKTHDVSGFDIRAYLCSIVASAIFLSYGIATHTWMLLLFAGVNFILGATETFLIYWYGVVNKMKTKDPEILEVGEEILNQIRHLPLIHPTAKKKRKKLMFKFRKNGNNLNS
mgnify:CR=1 FL=1